ncbi:MAG TPA: hypothetical protein VGC91_10525 [Pyrinomonadaceae bacterium]|jgi:hypothetical protein
MKKSLAVIIIALLLSLHCFQPAVASSQQTSKKYDDKLRGYELVNGERLRKDFAGAEV